MKKNNKTFLLCSIIISFLIMASQLPTEAESVIASGEESNNPVGRSEVAPSELLIEPYYMKN